MQKNVHKFFEEISEVFVNRQGTLFRGQRVVTFLCQSVNSTFFLLCVHVFYYTPRKRSSGGYIGITQSVRLSVSLSVCLCIFVSGR